MRPLSILCQSPMSAGMSSTQAVHNTVDLARTADELGYHRFWVAEHHSDSALASSSPEIMVAHIASVTKRIKVGSGGVLLPYYSPYKVAEQFNLLEALFPGRIDLGVGRAGGSEAQAAAALGVRERGGSFAPTDELLSWLGKGSKQRPYPNTFASPRPETCPQPWVLGTSPASASYAAQRGLPYAFGGFIDPRALMQCVSTYHQQFQPSAWLAVPRLNLVWVAQAAETQARAKELVRCSEHWFVQSFVRGQNVPFPAPATSEGAQYSPTEQMLIAMRREFALVGTGEQVAEGVEALAQRCHADEVTLVTIPFAHEDRVASYRLIAQARRQISPARSRE